MLSRIVIFVDKIMAKIFAGDFVSIGSQFGGPFGGPYRNLAAQEQYLEEVKSKKEPFKMNFSHRTQAFLYLALALISIIGIGFVHDTAAFGLSTGLRWGIAVALGIFATIQLILSANEFITEDSKTEK